MCFEVVFDLVFRVFWTVFSFSVVSNFEANYNLDRLAIFIGLRQCEFKFINYL